MRILIAEDDPVSRHMLETTLVKRGYDVVSVCDGVAAWQTLQSRDCPSLAILDWMMPGMSGIEVCREVRNAQHSQPIYIIMLTIKDQQEDIVAGLKAGADDYVTKPFSRGELHARVKVGIRILELQSNLNDRVKELEDALSQVKQLKGLLPICCYCKKIRDDQDYWQQVDHYITEHSEAEFTHGVCPDCYENTVKPELEKWKERGYSL